MGRISSTATVIKLQQGRLISPEIWRTLPRVKGYIDTTLYHINRKIMELLELENDVQAFGFQVKSFPEGVPEAFDALIAMVPEGLGRSYYGISYMDDQDKVVYIAAVEERNDGEAEKNNCKRYTLERGKYAAVTLKDWRQKTCTIKDIFHEMMDAPHIDHTKPCIEWYKNDDEMLCMLKVNLHELSESSN